MDTDRLFEEFPAPSYRGAQEAALRDIRTAFAEGNEVVLVRAPTGSGKSLLARAVAGCARRADAADPHQPTGAYYTTPQVSQLDDVAEDPLLSDLNVIRGKSNYTCILPDEEDTPVDRAPCARERGYDCSIQHRCPYFADRAIASNRRIAAMTLAYFMQTAGSDVFRARDVCVIDEAHGLAEWAEMYATIELGPETVPIWEDLDVPEIDGIDRAAEYAEALSHRCERRKDELLAAEDLTPAQARDRDRLQEVIGELDWFREDYRAGDGATTWLIDQREDGAITIKPLRPERYLAHTVWDRAERFALLSATILNKEAYCRGLGLDPGRVALVEVPHTFPLEHRPLYDVTQGKMTYEQRGETLPDLARTLVRLMARHPDEKGLVHCHAYAIQQELADRLADMGVDDRVLAHERHDREAALEAWKARDDPVVFLSVTMEEALDLQGDLARWQVLCKAPFPNTNDARVAHRLEEEDRWAWYYRTALRTVIQACGRIVRSPEDHGATYLADASLLDLFERARSDMPAWFREAVDAMDRPDLPPFDSGAALEAVTTPQSGGRGLARDAPRDGDRDDGEDDPSSPVADVWETE